MSKRNYNKSSNRREQPRKDTRSKRVNFDNTRLDKFDKDIERMDGDKDGGPKDPRAMKRTSKSNDIRWYAGNPELLKAAASVPFTAVSGDALSDQTSFSVPGVMALRWIPYYGKQSSPINQAANDIYSFTVHANSRNTNYNAVDQMMLIIAGSQVFAALAMGLRAYGVMRRFDQQDRYTPVALIRAMGFDYDDLRSNLANMWFDLNELIARSRQIWIPNVLPLIERQYWMNSEIYRDGSSIKAQYYMYVQAVFYQLNETASNQGTSLTAVKWLGDNGNTLNTWDAYKDMVNNLIAALLNSEDRGIIFGDILKAYGPESLYAMAPVTSEYTVDPVYDREVLTQFENATLFRVELAYGATSTNRYGGIGNVVQNVSGGYMYHEFVKTYSTNQTDVILSSPNLIYLNFHQLETPTPEQIMVATRMTTTGVENVLLSGNNRYSAPAEAGTEVLVDVAIIYRNATSGNMTTYNINDLLLYNSTTGNPNITSNVLLLYNSFDWAPGIQIVNPSASTFATGKFYSQLWYKIMDYDNFTSITSVDLSKMHTTAVYSEFGLPSKL